MKKEKKIPGRGYQIFSFMLLAFCAAAFFGANAVWNIASRAALIWFVLVFVNVFLIAFRDFHYVKTPAAWRRLKIVNVVLTVCIVLVPVSVMLPIGSGWRQYTFDAERAAIEAAMAIPDDQNAALLYRAVFEKLDPRPEMPDYVQKLRDHLLAGPWSPETHLARRSRNQSVVLD